MDAIYEVDELRQTLFPLFREFDVKKAILFGSYAKGTPNSQSDIDLLVDSGLKGLHFIGFVENVQRFLQKEVDVFDVSHVTPNSPIDLEIQKTGMLFYEK